MEVTNKPITLKNGTVLEGNTPIVIVGPNGAGKTTFGVELANRNQAEWVSSTRNLQFGDSIAMQPPEQARQQATQQKQQSSGNPWLLANDLNQILAKLKAEDAESAILFRNMSLSDSSAEPERTKIIELAHLWNSIFPGREIDFSSYTPRVKLGHRNNSQIQISRMSSGERVALYLLARVVDANPGIIVIDEPEIHFHSVLAKRFWSELEVIRSDCRFVYITHDLPFAISRKNGQFIVIKSDTEFNVLSRDEDIPQDIVESILGAATFSIAAKRIFFCEGSKYNQRDDSLYSAWFSNEETAVVPVGSCKDVIQCVEVFNTSPITKGTEAFGVIDRDYWPDEYLNNLPSTIHVLPFHEVESLVCTFGVFQALSRYLGISESEISEKYNEFLSDAKLRFTNSLLNKQIVERVKRRTEYKIQGILNGVSTRNDIEEVKRNFLDSLNSSMWGFSPNEIFNEECEAVARALSSDNELFLRIFPGKTIHSVAAGKLGITVDRLYSIISTALNISDIPERRPVSSIGMLKLKEELIQALSAHLPER